MHGHCLVDVNLAAVEDSQGGATILQRRHLRNDRMKVDRDQVADLQQVADVLGCEHQSRCIPGQRRTVDLDERVFIQTQRRGLERARPNLRAFAIEADRHVRVFL